MHLVSAPNKRGSCLSCAGWGHSDARLIVAFACAQWFFTIDERRGKDWIGRHSRDGPLRTCTVLHCTPLQLAALALEGAGDPRSNLEVFPWWPQVFASIPKRDMHRVNAWVVRLSFGNACLWSESQILHEGRYFGDTCSHVRSFSYKEPSSWPWFSSLGDSLCMTMAGECWERWHCGRYLCKYFEKQVRHGKTQEFS